MHMLSGCGAPYSVFWVRIYSTASTSDLVAAASLLHLSCFQEHSAKHCCKVEIETYRYSMRYVILPYFVLLPIVKATSLFYFAILLSDMSMTWRVSNWKKFGI